MPHLATAPQLPPATSPATASLNADAIPFPQAAAMPHPATRQATASRTVAAISPRQLAAAVHQAAGPHHQAR